MDAATWRIKELAEAICDLSAYSTSNPSGLVGGTAAAAAEVEDEDEYDDISSVAADVVLG